MHFVTKPDSASHAFWLDAEKSQNESKMNFHPQERQQESFRTLKSAYNTFQAIPGIAERSWTCRFSHQGLTISIVREINRRSTEVVLAFLHVSIS